MPQILEKPVEYLMNKLSATQDRWVIGLAGLPGSGKTTITQKWASEINHQAGAGTAKALSMDGFHLSKAQLGQMPDPDKAFARRGAYWTFDPVGFNRKVRALQTKGVQNSVFWPAFEHEVGDPIEDAIEVPANCRIVLVEGLYLLYRAGEWQALGGAFDEIWYLDTSMETSITRLIARHQQAWDFTEEQARHRVASSDYKNALLVESTRINADRLVLSD
jgi:pantothenate kinase